MPQLRHTRFIPLQFILFSKSMTYTNCILSDTLDYYLKAVISSQKETLLVLLR